MSENTLVYIVGVVLVLLIVVYFLPSKKLSEGFLIRKLKLPKISKNSKEKAKRVAKRASKKAAAIAKKTAVIAKKNAPLAKKVGLGAAVLVGGPVLGAGLVGATILKKRADERARAPAAVEETVITEEVVRETPIESVSGTKIPIDLVTGIESETPTESVTPTETESETQTDSVTSTESETPTDTVTPIESDSETQTETETSESKEE